MNSLDVWLAGGPALNLIFLLLAVAGLAGTLYFYRKGKRDKEPVYLVRTTPIISPNVFVFDGLKVSFKDEPVESLSLSRVALWNRGRGTIRRNDLVASDHLRIEPHDKGRVLAAQIVYKRRSTNNLHLSVEPAAVKIDFDYLDHLDGLVVFVFHSTTAPVHVKGTIVGAKSPAALLATADHWADRIFDSATARINPHRSKVQKTAFLVLLIALLPVLLVASGIGLAVKLMQHKPKEYTEDQWIKDALK